MSLNSFAPNTKIESSKVNANFTNFADHALWITLQWLFAGTLTTQTSIDYKTLPDDVLFERADLVVDTAPTGADLIVDIERSTDGGSTWVTIFTDQNNRPEVAASAKTGNTTSIDVPSGTANTHLYRAKIEQVGSTVAGVNLSVMLKGKYVLD